MMVISKTQSIIQLIQSRYPTITLEVSVLEQYKLEVYWDLHKPFCIDVEQVENDLSYTPPQKFLMVLLVAIKAFQQQAIKTGSDSTENPTQKDLKSVQAGSTRVEWTAKEGSFSSTYDQTLKHLYEEANKKALDLGFILDLAYVPKQVIEAYNNTENALVSVEWDEDRLELPF